MIRYQAICRIEGEVPARLCAVSGRPTDRKERYAERSHTSRFHTPRYTIIRGAYRSLRIASPPSGSFPHLSAIDQDLRFNLHRNPYRRS